MAKILAVDDDALARAVLVDALRGMHHEVVPASGGREALERLRTGGFALVITDVMMPEMDGIELARHVAALDKAPPVILASGVRGADVTADARAKGVEVAGFVAKPLHTDVLSRAITHAMGAMIPQGGGWSVEDLAAPMEARFQDRSPVRLLFLLHCLGASGTVWMETADRTVQIVVRSGRIVHVAGVPGLLDPLGRALPDQPDLTAAIGAAVAAGVGQADAFFAATVGLGVFLASLGSEGTVRWDLHASAPVGAIPLDAPIPRVLAIGFRERQPVIELRSFWSTVDGVAARFVPPADVPESRWGLDMTALRVMRTGARYRTVGEILAAAIGNDPDRRPDVLRAADLLFRLGILVLSSAAAPAPSAAPAPRSAEAEREADVTAQSLRAVADGWRGKHPVEVLGLGAEAKVTLGLCTDAWKAAAGEVHPDRFKSARADVRAAAEACFDALRAAMDAIHAPGGLDDANAFLDARIKGVPYVSEKDRAATKVALRRGETLFRSREWKAADASFLEAMRLDPLTWPIPFYHAWCGWLSRRIPPAEALQLLQAMTPKYPRQVAEVHVVKGTILKLEGKADAALVEFRAAAEADANNRDAARELRLHERRAQPVAPAGGTLIDNLRQTLTRPIGGSAAKAEAGKRSEPAKAKAEARPKPDPKPKRS